jgi:signal transduction histidine kinase
MSDDIERKLKFRPRARIIRTIGDQLISGPEAAVIELVKNAYDADASRVIVKFMPPLTAGKGRITVQDDGHGMSLEDIQNRWMEPATSSKVKRRQTAKGRVMMGSKGIGRFAAAKLGAVMGLNSVSQTDDQRVEVLIPSLDWSIFSEDTYLDAVAIDYLVQDTDLPTGTLIEIRELTETWTKDKLERLHKELRRVLSPFEAPGADEKFDIYLDLSGCTSAACGFEGEDVFTGDDPQGSLQNPADRYRVSPVPVLLFADYEVRGQFSADGRFTGTFENKRGAQAPQEIKLEVPLQPDEVACGVVKVELFIFDREAEAMKRNLKEAGFGELTAAKARSVLDSISGVAIFREGFRIRPYGDEDNDWLTLDSRRVQNPSRRIGHNQVAGYVRVSSDEDSNLVERSSREGFEQNTAFSRLHRLITTLLAEVVEPKRFDFRVRAGIARGSTGTFDEIRKLTDLPGVRRFVRNLSAADQATAERVIEREASQLTLKFEALEERQRLLEAQSSLGAILGEVLHEGSPKARYIANTVPLLLSQLKMLMAGRGTRFEESKESFEKRLPMVADAGEKLSSLFNNLRPLAGGKRGDPIAFNPINIIDDARTLYENHGIPTEIDNPSRIQEVFGYKSDLSTALVNLIGNSIHWIEQARTAEPRIVISVRTSGNLVTISITDNGPGVREEFIDSIFDVGFSTKDSGTGLGLNIAREALARSGAKLSYDAAFEGGARFVIGFPAGKNGDE